ncbi:hypothetical protein V6Z05_15520 [Leptospira venezuelensis]|uniref:hypothetical protein n=1 Tax=Leptospira venezuelensis TaxID=1958811 RepID=UPI000A369B43|nr:hypothetical protein [Leptospira venezuelensis]
MIKQTKIIFLFLFIVNAEKIFPQSYGGSICEQSSNPTLLQQVKTSKIPDLYIGYSVHEVTLLDMNGYQKLNIPTYKIKPIVLGSGADKQYRQESILAIEIVSVYKGEKYSDTLITEVSNE